MPGIFDRLRGRTGEPDPPAAEETVTTPGPPRWSQPRALTPDQVREVRRRNAEGESQLRLAREFGVSQPAIRRMITRETYRDVE